jgi:short-subunit dehydrogenase
VTAPPSLHGIDGADGRRRRTALVTGASSGIGRALAEGLAARGYDLALAARDRGALDRLAADLAMQHRIMTYVVDVDLASDDGVHRLLTELDSAGKQIDVLVHNAGFGIHGGFATSPLTDEHRMVALQIGAYLTLTKRLVPGMIERGFGRILTVSSVYAVAPVPGQSIYGACKAFLYSASAALRDELRGSGVTVTVLAPGSTRTEFRSRAGVKEKKPGGSGMSAEAVAEAGLRALERGCLLSVPGFANKVFVFFARRLPVAWVAPLLRRINGVRLGGSAGH